MVTTKRDISLIVVIVAGFTQQRNAVHGMAKLYEHVARTYFDRRISCVMLESWETDPTILADKIGHHYTHACTKLALIGYSWGNPTLDRVEKRLAEYLITADWRAYVDPIPRLIDRWWSLLNIIAMTRLGKFIRRARTADLFIQRNSRPLGRLVHGVTSERTHVFGAHSLIKVFQIPHGNKHHNPAVGHDQIDDQDVVHRIIHKRLEELAA